MLVYMLERWEGHDVYDDIGWADFEYGGAYDEYPLIFESKRDAQRFANWRNQKIHPNLDIAKISDNIRKTGCLRVIEVQVHSKWKEAHV